MGMIEQEAFCVKTPNISSVKVYSITTSSAVLGDLSSDLGTLSNRGHWLTVQADGADVYVAFNNANSGTVDETATTGATQCYKLTSGIPYNFVLRGGYTYLVAKGASATKLRCYVSSFNISE